MCFCTIQSQHNHLGHVNDSFYPASRGHGDNPDCRFPPLISLSLQIYISCVRFGFICGGRMKQEILNVIVSIIFVLCLFYFILHCVGLNNIQEMHGLTTVTQRDGSYHWELVLSELQWGSLGSLHCLLVHGPCTLLYLAHHSSYLWNFRESTGQCLSPLCLNC